MVSVVCLGVPWCDGRHHRGVGCLLVSPGAGRAQGYFEKENRRIFGFCVCFGGLSCFVVRPVFGFSGHAPVDLRSRIAGDGFADCGREKGMESMRIRSDLKNTMAGRSFLFSSRVGAGRQGSPAEAEASGSRVGMEVDADLSANASGVGPCRFSRFERLAASGVRL